MQPKVESGVNFEIKRDCQPFYRKENSRKHGHRHYRATNGFEEDKKREFIYLCTSN